MFDQNRLKGVLVQYKKDFPSWFTDHEKFKWEAVKCFQMHWNANAENFSAMLNRSLDKTSDLLMSQNHFSKSAILEFAKAAPEEVRTMFADLFDESKDVFERMDAFKKKSSALLTQYRKNAAAHNHYQDENAISTYLWLRYPDKYYIYKFGVVKATASEVGADYSFKKGTYKENIRNFLSFYDELNTAIKEDTELVSLLQSYLTDDCYPDPEFKTLTQDLGLYISERVIKHEADSSNPEADSGNLEAASSKPEVDSINPYAYSKADFLNEVYMTEESCDSLLNVLRNKKNIILQGAPGVGKTFAARRLAWSMMGEKDNSRIEFVQFHQNYSYEDFVMGYKPAKDGFELKHGIFYQFCQKAAGRPDKEFFFIIDEINRGNMSKIFGELLMLIEKDYRGTEVTLAYAGLPFSVPENLYIIGMMNTADRSLAMIDYALRRRFSFFDMEPGFDSEGFTRYRNGLNNEMLNRLIDKIKELNCEITLDKSLGKGFCIGHSYFCGMDTCTEDKLHAIVDYDILPMLREYWFDDAGKLRKWETALQGVFQ